MMMFCWHLVLLLLPAISFRSPRVLLPRIPTRLLLSSTPTAFEQESQPQRTTTNDNYNNNNNNNNTIEMVDEIRSSFISYSLSTILGRSIPDARDGLKPVHRRIAYALYQLYQHTSSSSTSSSSNGTFRKCARIVGEVLGKYHPHSDQSVYNALIRLTTTFDNNNNIIDGHGNFGSVDGDDAAAMRYTECRLSKFGFDVLFADVDEVGATDGKVLMKMVDNFDGNEKEPLLLPARLPLLLINGAMGVAVGMATHIPPHNLGEICDAMVALIDNPDLTNEELHRLVPAPDFPTGGIILNTTTATTTTTTVNATTSGGGGSFHSLHDTGKGSTIVRAKMHVEEITTTTTTTTTGGGKYPRLQIVVTELPFMTNKAELIKKIAELVQEKKIDGITDLRDESDRDGLRVVLECRRDVNHNNIGQLQKKLLLLTPLQTSISSSMVMLVQRNNSHNNNNTYHIIDPLQEQHQQEQHQQEQQQQQLEARQVCLLDLLRRFLCFREEVVRCKTLLRLQRVRARQHIVAGLLHMLPRINDIVDLLRTSRDTNEVKAILTSNNNNNNSSASSGLGFNFSEEQAEAILSLRLSRLSSLESDKLSDEHRSLLLLIAEHEATLRQREKVLAIIRAETLAIKQQHATPRKSEIRSNNNNNNNDYDYDGEEGGTGGASKERCVVMITTNGYVKRIPLSDLQQQQRGGKGKQVNRHRSSTKNKTRKNNNNKNDSNMDVNSNSKFWVDGVEQAVVCGEDALLLLIRPDGVAHRLPVNTIPMTTTTTATTGAAAASRGTPLGQLLPSLFSISSSRKQNKKSNNNSNNNNKLITAIIPLTPFSKDKSKQQQQQQQQQQEEFEQSLVLLTRKGVIKKIALSSLRHINNRGLRLISLQQQPQQRNSSQESVDVEEEEEDDVLQWVKLVNDGRVNYRHNKNINNNDNNDDNNNDDVAAAIAIGDEMEDSDAIASDDTNNNNINEIDNADDKFLQGNNDEDDDNDDDGFDDVVVATAAGFATRFSVAALPRSSRSARGTRAVTLRPRDHIVDIDVLPTSSSSYKQQQQQGKREKEERFVLLVTKQGFGKRVNVHAIKRHRRGGRGIAVIKFKNKPTTTTTNVTTTATTRDSLCALRFCGLSDMHTNNNNNNNRSSADATIDAADDSSDDVDVVLVSGGGKVLRQRVSLIPTQSRTATGVRLQQLPVHDHVLHVNIAPSSNNNSNNNKGEEEEEEEVEEEEESGGVEKKRRVGRKKRAKKPTKQQQQQQQQHMPEDKE